MKTGEKYFVRIDQKLSGDPVGKSVFDSHIEYVRRLAAETTLYAGGFKGVQGGMLIFKAKNLVDADAMCKGDPIMAGGFYTYKLHEWSLLITSESKKKMTEP